MVTTTGHAYRIVPLRNGRQATDFWKFWVSGDELYAVCRSDIGGLTKVSVHKSGQIHVRLGEDKRQIMARPKKIGAWLHAIEVRFLLSHRAFLPKTAVLKKNKKAFAVELNEDEVLFLNLLVAENEQSDPLELTDGSTAPFFMAEMAWWTKLRSQLPVILLSRKAQINEEDKQHIRYIREELKPTAHFTNEPRNFYGEIRHFHYSDGGNVILVIPQGPEAITVDGPAAGNSSPG